MKRIKILILLIFSFFTASSQLINRDGWSVWMGNMYLGHPRTGTVGSGNSNTWLQLGKDSTNRSMLLPRVVNNGVIGTPANGMFQYNLTNGKVYYYSGGMWRPVLDSISGGTIPISSLTAAMGANSINNGNNQQTWNWNSLSGYGFLVQSSATTASNGSRLLYVQRSGTNSNAGVTSYSGYFSNSHIGTSSTNIAGLFSAQSGTNNYAIIVPSGGGNVGFGTSTPNASALLDVESTTQGAVLPRMNTAQQNAISTPATGLLIYNTDSATICHYNGSAWLKLSGGGGGVNIYNSDGTLTGNRLVSANNNSFQIDSFSTIGFFGKSANPSSVLTRKNIYTFNSDDSGLDGIYLQTFQNGGIGKTRIELKNEDINIDATETISINTQDSADVIIGKLPSGSSTDSVLVWTAGTGQVKKRNVSSLVSTPTLQQVLTAGSTLTKNDTIYLNSYLLRILNNGAGYLVIDPTLNNEYAEFRSYNPTEVNVARLKVNTTNLLSNGQFEADFGDGVNVSRVDVQSSSGVSKVVLNAYNDGGSLNESYLHVELDSIYLKPEKGALNIDSLRSFSAVADTLYKKPMTWDTRNGRWEYAANWPQQKINLVFGAGSGADADTTAFTTSALYGSFYNDADTIVVTSFRAVLQGTSPDVTYKIWYNDSLNVEAGATALNTAGNQVTNTTTGTNVTSITNTKIPPGNWVWVKTSTVATKPKYFSLTVNGYRK